MKSSFDVDLLNTISVLLLRLYAFIYIYIYLFTLYFSEIPIHTLSILLIGTQFVYLCLFVCLFVCLL